VPSTTSKADSLSRQRERRGGWAYGLMAYVMWGVFPLYFRALAQVSPWLIVCHRIVWSAVFLGLIVTVQREWPQLLPVMRVGRNLRMLAAGGVLIAANWLIVIYAVTTDQLLESSLGYFINPLFSVALGLVFLGERLRRWQWVAVGIAAVAVLNLGLHSVRIPWIALSLAGSFGCYGLVRKKVDLPSLHALLVETTILVPLAMAGLVWLPAKEASGDQSGVTLLLLGLTGVITATPLLCFGVAVRRLNLSTVGFLQYIGPTLQFLIAILVFHEPLEPAKLTSFCLIWVAIVVYVADSLVSHVAQPVADRPE
jgi:chloramphenicol-sensitive protein RarD